MSESTSAPIHSWLVEPLDAPVRAVIERLARREDVVRLAVMPDVHLGESSCIGVALATRRALYFDAVGTDVGCGMAALAFDADSSSLTRGSRASELLSALADAIPIIRHPTRDAAPALSLDPRQLSHSSLHRAAERRAAIELGTLGRGNHFVEFQADANQRLWLMVHSGSRAAGQFISDHHNLTAQPRSQQPLDISTPEGQAAMNDLAWATAFAAENRAHLIESAARAVRRVLGIRPDADTFVDLPHNFVALEHHFNEPLLVHRKGAAPAEPGRLGLIPGSMGTTSYHVQGRGHPDSLHSSSHGAGRRLSRGDARRAVSPRALERQMGPVVFNHRAVRSLVEESPAAYKDIDAVMRAQTDLVRIERRVTPLLAFKGT